MQSWINPKGRMSCREARGLIEPYTHGELELDRVHAVAGHLAACGACQQEFETCFAVRGVLDSYPRIEAAPGFNQRVLNLMEANMQAARLAAQPVPARASWRARQRPIPVLHLFGSAVAGVGLGLAMGITICFPAAWPRLYAACNHAVIVTLQGRSGDSVTRDLSIVSTNAVTPPEVLPDKDSLPDGVEHRLQTKPTVPTHVQPERRERLHAVPQA